MSEVVSLPQTLRIDCGGLEFVNIQITSLCVFSSPPTPPPTPCRSFFNVILLTMEVSCEAEQMLQREGLI